MLFFKNSERFYLFSYFIGLILLGTILLSLPFAWGKTSPLSLIDALFTATSAVCVTGLITVDTASYTFFGQCVILFLIQFGGLGVITFTTVYLIMPIGKVSLKNRKIIKSFSIDAIDYEPTRIVKQIVLYTFILEALGAVLLFFSFNPSPGWHTLYISLFHSISAFCNAGFSLFSENLEGYLTNTGVNLTIMFLIVSGGIGFPVIRDLIKKIKNKQYRLTLHSRIVLLVTAVLILISAASYFILENEQAFKGLTIGQKIMASFFQAIVPRTAGFDTIAPSKLSFIAKLITIPLMFVGAAPASIAGGIKITTMLFVLIIIFRERDSNGEITVFDRKVSAKILFDSLAFTLRALMILAIGIFFLSITEHVYANTNGVNFFSLIFESTSAFGTVGLSLGITGLLSTAGKIVIILTMFAGRVGLISIAISGTKKYSPRLVDLPKEEVLIG
jgi:trk system potassium uptake protein TrkH